MSTVINTNTFSIYAQTRSSLTLRAEQTAMERLTSGKSINQAKDDAAGVAFVGKLDSQISGMSKALQNVNDGISMVEVGDGAMGNIVDVLQRMRDLSVHSLSGTLSDVNHSALQTEFAMLQDEIKSVIDNTKFNAQPILNRPADGPSTIGFHVGIDASGATVAGQYTGIPVSPVTKTAVSTVGVDGEVRGRYTGEDLSGTANASESLSVPAGQSLVIKVDGISSGTVNVAEGTKTKAEWATELQNLINADATLVAASKSVTVNYNDSIDKYEIDSGSTGGGSTVEMAGALSAFGLHHVFGTSTQINTAAVAGTYEGFEMAGAAGDTENATLAAEGNIMVNVDGVSSGTINLSPGAATTQSKSAWASALETAINADATLAAASKSVTVAYDAAKDAFVMTSGSGGSSSRVMVLTASESMSALGVTPSGKPVDLVSLEGVATAERQLTFTVDGTAQPQITLPETTLSVAQWAIEMEALTSGVQFDYDEDLKKYQITSDKIGYGSTVSFTGEVPNLGITAAGQSELGYSNINEIRLDYYDLDDTANALGAILVNTETIGTQTDATGMLAKIDAAIGFVNEGRGHFAAVQNRLTTVSQYIEEAKTNRSDGRSALKDADFAVESAELAKMDILKQVSNAMMAQANQLPEQMLQLFK